MTRTTLRCALLEALTMEARTRFGYNSYFAILSRPVGYSVFMYRNKVFFTRITTASQYAKALCMCHKVRRLFHGHNPLGFSFDDHPD
jgi:hypothetical protein